MGAMSKKQRKTDLGEQLRQAAIESGLSRFALSKRAGIPYAGIHRFMAGQRSFTLDTASRLAAVLGLELAPVGKRKG